MDSIRHGDLLLIRVGELPPQPPKSQGGRHVLLEGEMTGHAHVLHAPACREADTLWVLEPGELRHEEHKTVQLSPGVYEVRRQREYWAASDFRPVRD